MLSINACLTEAKIRSLGRLADQVEHLLDVPQDTEFAVDRAGRLWLTQARPITTLLPATHVLWMAGASISA
jgi:pyruvate,water dikinase